MRLFLDMRLGYLVTTPGADEPLSEISFKSGDHEELILQFGRSSDPTSVSPIFSALTWTPENLPGGSSISAGIKTDTSYSDGVILAIANSWTNNTGAYTYSADLNLNTTEVNAELARGDSNSANDVASVGCNFEVTYLANGATGWRSSVMPITATVYHDVIYGDEGTPASAEDPSLYLLKSEAASTTSGNGASLIGIEDAGSLLAATTVEGALAEIAATAGSAVQLGDLATVATTGAYSDLIGAPTSGDALTSGTLDQFANVTQAGGATLSIASSTTLNGGTHSGVNTGDQTNISGNAATVTTNANLTGPVTSVGNATSIANGAISNAMLANSAVANLSGTNTGDQDLSGLAVKANNLSDLTNAATARANLGLGTAATTAATDYATAAQGTDERVPTAAGITTKFGTNKATIADGDKITMLDSAASDAPKHALFSLFKSTLKTYFDTLYNLYVLPVAGTTTIGGVKRNAGAAGQYVTGFNSDGSALYDEPTSGYRPGRNHLINGNFAVAQRAVETNIPDDSYFIDRWYALSDGNIMEAQRQSVHSEGRDQVLAVSTSGAGAEASKKYGIAQIIEAANCIDLVGKTVTLSFDARLYGGSNPVELKAAVIAWSGTADTVTSDIISSWNAVTTTPTLIANATFENTPAAVSLSGSWQNFSLTCDVDTSGTENLIVFIWADNPPSSGPEYFYITNVQLEAGSAATPFERPILSDQLARCQRYYEVLRYNSDTYAAISTFFSASNYYHYWYFKVEKFKAPTISSTLVTGSWAGSATPTIYVGKSCANFYRTTTFNAVGTAGNVALAADAEL
jgi:hypothetical protein